MPTCIPMLRVVGVIVTSNVDEFCARCMTRTIRFVLSVLLAGTGSGSRTDCGLLAAGLRVESRNSSPRSFGLTGESMSTFSVTTSMSLSLSSACIFLRSAGVRAGFDRLIIRLVRLCGLSAGRLRLTRNRLSNLARSDGMRIFRSPITLFSGELRFATKWRRTLAEPK